MPVSIGNATSLFPHQNFLTGKNRNLGFSGIIQAESMARYDSHSRAALVQRQQLAVVQRSELRCDMLPYWMELSASDLMQGTALLAMLATIFSLQFLLPTGRA